MHHIKPIPTAVQRALGRSLALRCVGCQQNPDEHDLLPYQRYFMESLRLTPSGARARYVWPNRTGKRSLLDLASSLASSVRPS